VGLESITIVLSILLKGGDVEVGFLVGHSGPEMLLVVVSVR